MQDKLNTLIAGHGLISMAVTFAIGIFSKHYWPQFKNWITGTGADKFAVLVLYDFKKLLKQSGATDDEIKSIEILSLQVLTRISSDLEKDTAQPKA